MAVVMTTKFYEEDTPAWHDLSKVVFTSPNMDSPNSAGTRSHILPGQLDLGMWYEDTSNMYIIEDKQEFDTSTYFGYLAQTHAQFDMGDPPLYITIDQTDQEDWIEYVRERVNIGIDSWPMKYDNICPEVLAGVDDAGCTFSGGVTDAIFTVFGWEEDILPVSVCINYPAPFYITGISFGTGSQYRTNEFKLSSGSVELLVGNHSVNTAIEKFLIPYTTEKYSDYCIELISSHEDPTTVSGSVTYLVLFGYTSTFIDSITCSSGTIGGDILTELGWHVDELDGDPHWVNVEFSSPRRITKVQFYNYEGYEIKDYKIQACTTSSGTCVDLYEGKAPSTYEEAQIATFSNYIGYTNYRFYIYSKYVSAAGYGVKSLTMYEYSEDESITNPITLYIDNENTIDVSHVNNAESTDYLFKLNVDSVDGTGVVVSGTSIYGWGQTGTSDVSEQVRNVNSILFEVTLGECYNCRLTAWDDVTHSTTLNHLIASDRCRVSCLVYNANGTALSPTENDGISFIHPPVLNQIFKGNVVYEGENLYYGDFDMIYRTGAVLGDYLIFKPMLYNIDDTVPYGIHDHVITLHYSYT